MKKIIIFSAFLSLLTNATIFSKVNNQALIEPEHSNYLKDAEQFLSQAKETGSKWFESAKQKGSQWIDQIHKDVASAQETLSDHLKKAEDLYNRIKSGVINKVDACTAIRGLEVAIAPIKKTLDTAKELYQQKLKALLETQKTLEENEHAYNSIAQKLNQSKQECKL